MESTTTTRPSVPCSLPQLSPSGETEGAKNLTQTDGESVKDPDYSNWTNSLDNKPSSSGRNTLESMIITNEPYEPVWTSVNRRKPTKYKTKRQFKQLISLDELFNQEKHYEKFFNIKFAGYNLHKDINIIKTEKDIKIQVGKPKRIDQLNVNTLLIEAADPEQAKKIKTIKTLNEINVFVESHRHFNGAKGVVRSAALDQNSEEELLECFKEQGVRDIRRIKVKKDGELTNTNTYILTFNASSCPRVIKVTEWHYEAVEDYKYRPQQCYRCQKFGHITKYCRRSEEICSRCGNEGHKNHDCTGEIQCTHCKRHHYSSDKRCPKYLCEELIIEA